MDETPAVDAAGPDLSPLLNPNTPEQAEAAIQALRGLPGYPRLDAITRDQRFVTRASE